MGITVMDILCCHIIIGDTGPSNSTRIQDGVKITEVRSLKISESRKKLTGTVKVIFLKGPACHPTIIGSVILEGKDVPRITTEVMQDGVIIEKRSVQRLADEITFKVEQRINIKLNYNDVLKNMFGGYTTGYNSDSTLEIQCENMAYRLKLKQAPHFETPTKGTTVNEVLGGKYDILKGTDFRIHSDTERSETHIGEVKVTDSFTIADILSEWSEHKVYRLLRYGTDDDGIIPSIAVGRLYSPNKAQPVLPEDESTGLYRIYFNEHMAQGNLKVVKINPKFPAVTDKALGTDERFFEVTVCMNPEYDPVTPDSKEFQTVNATRISKEAHKVTGNTTTLGAKTRIKVDLSTYTIVPYMSLHVGANSDRLVEETTEYPRGYNLNGITGNMTVLGGFGLSLTVQVELTDCRNPSKNGVYPVEEVTTTSGVGGYRQQLNILYKIRK